MATVNWPRGLAKVLVLALFAFGYLLWSNGGTLPGSIKFWGIIALLILPEMATGLAGHYLEQTGRPGVGKLITFAGLAWLFGAGFFLASKAREVTLTYAERAPLVTVDDGHQRRLRHPTLGFSLLHPGPGFVEGDPNASRPSAHFYSFTDAEARVRVTVGISRARATPAPFVGCSRG